MKRVLIVANRTAGGRHLRDEVKRRVAREPHSFFLVVPPSPPHHTMTFTEGEALAEARERLERALASLRELGADIEGIVGVSRPMDAVAEVLWTRSFDEIIVSTLPHAISRWLRIDLPHRVEKRFGIPVTHVVGEPEEVGAGRRAG